MGWIRPMAYAASSARELGAKPCHPREETTLYVDRVTLGMKYVFYDKGDEMFQELVEKDEELIKMPVVFADEPGVHREGRGRHLPEVHAERGGAGGQELVEGGVEDGKNLLAGVLEQYMHSEELTTELIGSGTRFQPKCRRGLQGERLGGYRGRVRHQVHPAPGGWLTDLAPCQLRGAGWRRMRVRRGAPRVSVLRLRV
jgi:hypothetical protein